MRCPHCGSVDVGDLVIGGRACLDCGGWWLAKSDRRWMSVREQRSWKKQRDQALEERGLHQVELEEHERENS